MRRLIRAFCLLCGCVLCLQVAFVPAQARVVYRYASGDGRRRVALTFDDGPHPKYTPQILDILAEYHVPATFFVVGSNAEYYPQLVERIHREGHEIGNHTFHHRHVSKMTDEELLADVLACRRVIEDLTGRPPTLFRPPEGICNDSVKAICEKLDMTIIIWSVDTTDWAHPTQQEILENVRTNTKHGSIILMHDFIGQKSPTPAALRKIIPMLRGLGYEFVTVSQLLGAP